MAGSGFNIHPRVKRILPLAVLLALAYCVLQLFGGWGLMFDLAEPSGNAPEPVQLYPIGRLVLPAPTALKYIGSSYKLDEIAIKEKSWMSEDRAAEWHASWQPVRDEGERSYLTDKEQGWSYIGCFAEKDLSQIFGKQAFFVCYKKDASYNLLDTFILLPDILLRITEDRFYEEEDECGDIDVSKTQLPLFKSYRYGKENPAPDSFFTAQGRIEGLKFKNERSSAYFKLEHADGLYSDLSLRMYVIHNESANAFKSMTEGIALARSMGVEIEILRSRQRDFNGMKGLEEVMLMTEKKKSGKVDTHLVASWYIKGEPGNPEKPYIRLEMSTVREAHDGGGFWRSNPKLKEQTLRMWKTVTEQLTTAKEYYSR